MFSSSFRTRGEFDLGSGGFWLEHLKRIYCVRLMADGFPFGRCFVTKELSLYSIGLDLFVENLTGVRNER